MAPNSEERSRKEGQLNFLEEIMNKEKQRPPIYNPEDYALMLKKWGRKSSNGGLMSLYSNSSTSGNLESTRSPSNSFRDYRNPMLTSSGSEMTLRQFGTVSELLTKLKTDLKLAFPSFVQEFVADPLDGVALLLDLLRAIQLSQSNAVIHGPANSSSTGTSGKLPPSLQRRALLDELSCLQCLLSCCVRYTESLRKLISSSAGLFTVAVCIMSNVNKSRIIALQLLTKACDPSIGGHSAVSEAMSTLRLRFGEPVRFRFLVGMIMSAGGQKELIASGLRFLNKFMDTAGSSQKRLYVQSELDQAGLDVNIMKKNIDSISGNEQLQEEIQYWEKKNINIENISFALDTFRKDNAALREKIALLEKRIKALQDEKGVLSCVEKTLKVKCNELQSEIRSLKSSKGSYTKNTHDLTPNEDEGISSSERSLSPDEDPQRTTALYNSYMSKDTTLGETKDEEDEETTIDEVIEELRNIINDAESEDLAKIEQRKLEQETRRIEEAQVASKLKIHIDADDYAIASENEIVPSNLHPQPPRRAKSLVHLFVPSEDYYYCPKELFFENETPYTSTEGSDSLLSASKYAVPRITIPETVNLSGGQCKKVSEVKSRALDKKLKKGLVSKTDIKRSESFRHLDNGFCGSYYYSTTVNVCQNQNNVIERQSKCKSLERIDHGLDSMVDVVVTTNQNFDLNQSRSRSDSANSNNSLMKSVSNVYIKGNNRSRFGSYSDEKPVIFLPAARESITNASYYFSKAETKAMGSGFLIKRGHENAGKYSGQHPPEGRNSLTKSKEFCSLNSGTIGGKLTDLPSGLY
ncbi:hypothetical protein ABEB36_010490 [Hypothenemus hampei]